MLIADPIIRKKVIAPNIILVTTWLRKFNNLELSFDFSKSTNNITSSERIEQNTPIRTMSDPIATSNNVVSKSVITKVKIDTCLLLEPVLLRKYRTNLVSGKSLTNEPINPAIMYIDRMVDVLLKNN